MTHSNARDTLRRAKSSSVIQIPAPRDSLGKTYTVKVSPTGTLEMITSSNKLAIIIIEIQVYDASIVALDTHQ